VRDQLLTGTHCSSRAAANTPMLTIRERFGAFGLEFLIGAQQAKLRQS